MLNFKFFFFWTSASLIFIIGFVHSTSSLLGIHPLDEKYFDSKVIRCKDGLNSFTRDRLNDNYCDCVDGTDEPGTAACPTSKFYCRNIGSAPKFIFSSRVNDRLCGYIHNLGMVNVQKSLVLVGWQTHHLVFRHLGNVLDTPQVLKTPLMPDVVAFLDPIPPMCIEFNDCCDGSDEYDGGIHCPNTCIMGGGLRYKFESHHISSARKTGSVGAKETKTKIPSEDLVQKLKGLRLVTFLQAAVVVFFLLFWIFRRRSRSRRRHLR